LLSRLQFSSILSPTISGAYTMDSDSHPVWAPWNHPDTTAFSEYLIGSRMLEDDTAVRKAMLDALPALVSTICPFPLLLS
jgi:hypothetical protein